MGANCNVLMSGRRDGDVNRFELMAYTEGELLFHTGLATLDNYVRSWEILMLFVTFCYATQCSIYPCY